MNPDKSFDINLHDIKWDDLPAKTKEEILEQHSNYVELMRRATCASGAYNANLRTLMFMLFVSLIMVLNEFENRKILLTVVSIQFAKTLLSRLFEANFFAALDIAKKDLVSFLKRKIS